MKDNVLFLNMFALYEPKAEHRALLESARIRCAELDPAERRISSLINSFVGIGPRLMSSIQPRYSREG